MMICSMDISGFGDPDIFLSVPYMDHRMKEGSTLISGICSFGETDPETSYGKAQGDGNFRGADMGFCSRRDCASRWKKIRGDSQKR